MASLLRPVTPAAEFWEGRRVLVTGHTGFMGAWLTLWLRRLGATVSGVARAVPGPPSLYALAGAGEGVEHTAADVCDPAGVRAAFERARPEVVFHLAGQPLVRDAVAAPVQTYATNVMGTVNVLEAAAAVPGVRAVVLASSQDVYEDRAWEWAYREDDRLGARSPYGGAKACAELVAGALRRSLLAEAGVNVATARAGNTIGGGDWGRDRLVPDVMRAALDGRPLEIRAPDAVRPWQFVLDPLHGYLLLAERLFDDPTLATAFNFGPSSGPCTVRALVERLEARWGSPLAVLDAPRHAAVDAAGIRLDSSRAAARLGWRSAWGLDRAVDATVDWYRAYERGGDLRALALAQIEEHSPTLARR